MLDLEKTLDALSREARPPYIFDTSTFEPGKSTVLYSGPFWDHEELQMALRALLTGKWLTTGEYTHKFQIGFSKRFNVAQSHMVNSGSSANLVLITALKKHLGWKDGDEVVVSPVGFPTTISPLIQNNLKPAFVDIELRTLNFDVDRIEAAIHERTRAIFVSPVLGNPPDMDRIAAICKARGVTLIGDNCDSLGTRYKGKDVSDYYFAWSSSFYPAHHITTGEGGMVSSNDEKLIDLCRSISWWGRGCYCVGAANLLKGGTCGNRFDRWLEGYDGTIDHKYLFENVGYNLKPLDLQGAIGLAQLKKLDRVDELRRAHKERIGSAIAAHVRGARVGETTPGGDPSWFGVPIICDSREIKEGLVAHFEDNLVQTRSYFAGNILLHAGFKHLDDAAKYPNANKALSNVFFLGCSPSYTEPMLRYIESVVRKWAN